jgi:hypothetical protein
MSQANDEVFVYEPVTNQERAPEWWENAKAFAPTSLPRSSKIQERHDIEPIIESSEEFHTEAFFNRRVSNQLNGERENSKPSKPTKAVRELTESHKKENWLLRRGHTLSYIGLFLFTVTVFFRPYELIPALSGFNSMAFVFALLTLIVFVPTQLGLEGTFTTRPTEVNMVLLLTGFAIITMPIAKSPAMAWEEFNASFIKAVLMFIVMVNVIRTEYRLKGIMWIGIAVGVWLSLNALEDYQAGRFTVEGYRIEGSIGGMFGNPNDMALHLVTMMPLTLAFLMSADNTLKRAVYGFCFVALVAGTMVTFSRGGFIGMIASLGVLLWKIGKKKRLLVVVFGVLFLAAFTALAPGNYMIRILSIFIPGLDPVGSSDHRSILLQQSIWVTLRNPWGIGMGNFPIVSSRNLVSHNAYTQVSAELGIAALIVYIVFMVKPLKRLREIEQETFDSKESSKLYYLATGLQASIIGYMVGSFFASVAYQWLIYYLVAYAVAFRRIYVLTQSEKAKQESVEDRKQERLRQTKLLEANT